MRISIVASLLASAAAAVTEVGDKTIQEFLDRNIPTILTLYAEWCGHCKTFAPTFEAISEEFAHLDDQIQFLRVDGDRNRRTSNAFDLKYFPTVLYVDGDYHVEIDSRDPKSVKKIIEQKTGLTPSTPGKQAPKVNREAAESHVLTLIDDTFEAAIEGKHALVAFTAEWCTHCRKLLPEWEKLSQLYSHDDDMVIANVDCTDMTPVQNLVEIFDISAFPTVVYFGDRGPSLYTEGRSMENFVSFLKRVGASSRGVDGQLDESAGVVDLESGSVDSIRSQVAGSQYADLYTKILTKYEADPAYLDREHARLDKLLQGDLKLTDRDAFKIKRNIISSLQKTLSDEKSEL